LLGLERIWSGRDHFFITEDTALGRSIASGHRAYFVAHYGLGQMRQGATIRMLAGAAANFVRSAMILFRERPDIFISTGAGPMFFPLLWARLLGAKIVVVESFARFNKPSAFGRGAAPFAHLKVVQSQKLAAIWPDSVVFNPLQVAPAPATHKRALVFVTVGATLPFDRLITMVAELKVGGGISEDLLMQVGEGGLKPRGVAAVESLTYDEIQTVIKQADIVVCHGGTGSIISALRQGCKVVAVARSPDDHEVYDDHQKEIIAAFSARGLIQTADSPATLAAALRRARAAPRVAVRTDATALTDFLEAQMLKWKPRSDRSYRTTAARAPSRRNSPPSQATS
jgi:UDP-N-acetylglucosamine transferase subunit ALG13